MNWNGNLDSSIGKSARLVIWRSEVRIPVQVQFFIFKSKSISTIINYKVIEVKCDFKNHYLYIVDPYNNSSREKRIKFIPWTGLRLGFLAFRASVPT